MTFVHRARTALAIVALSLGATAVSWAQGTTPASSASAVTLAGAGATFPAPLYKKWVAIYHAAHPNVVSISYSAVGSGESIKRYIARPSISPQATKA